MAKSRKKKITIIIDSNRSRRKKKRVLCSRPFEFHQFLKLVYSCRIVKTITVEASWFIDLPDDLVEKKNEKKKEKKEIKFLEYNVTINRNREWSFLKTEKFYCKFSS